MFAAGATAAAGLTGVHWAPAANLPSESCLISGGLLVDGTGASPRRADVRISGRVISAVGTLKPIRGERVVQARGLVVSPGFIDAHSHADGGWTDAPDLESQIRQGITTAVVGQDGGSATPLETLRRAVRERRPALNFVSYVGHGTLRRLAMGADYRRVATPAELTAMSERLKSDLASGAVGLSTGLEYDPGFHSETSEVIELARVAAAGGGRYISHIRNEDDRAFESFDELFRIAREAPIPSQISHIKLGSQRVWGRASDALGRISEARASGLSITADIYPYLYWQSSATVLNPARDWDDLSAWETSLQSIGGAAKVHLVRYTPRPEWAGRTLAELSTREGKSPPEMLRAIARNTRGPDGSGSESVVVEAMQEADLRKFIRSPLVMFCSDGGPLSAHPRSAGSYPRVLGRYVRELRDLRLEEAIRKMTAFPASVFGLRDRGRVAAGLRADLVLLDPVRVRDQATISDPKARPVGIQWVFVNGRAVLAKGVMTGERPGRFGMDDGN